VLIKHLGDCALITANDGCRLRELLHPRKDAVALPYSLAVAYVAPGKRSDPHFLRQTEVYFILTGHGLMHIGKEVEPVASGDAVAIPAGQTQWIENAGDETLEFVAIVSPPWRAEDDIRVDWTPGGIDLLGRSPPHQ